MASISSAVTMFVMTRAVPLLTKAVLGQVLAVRGAIAFDMETWHRFHSGMCHLRIVANVTDGKWSRGRSATGLLVDTSAEGVGWNAAPLLRKRRVSRLSRPVFRHFRVVRVGLGIK